MLKKVYAVFDSHSQRILRMSYDKGELVEYINSFPSDERIKLILAERVCEANTPAGWRVCQKK
jgi:hypothetical protein